jgi:hypothetical protein
MGKKPNGYWTFERCEEEGQKYSSRRAWYINSRSSYNAALRNGWLDQIIPESRYTVPRGHWGDFENCKAEGQKYSSRRAWYINSVSSYDAARRNGWVSQIIPETADSTSDNDAVYLYEFEYAGVRLHKIGLTSIKRNTERIETIMRQAGCTATNVIFWHVEDARDIERKMLEVGQPQDLYKGDGFTEMRILTPQEQRRVMRIAGDACISNPVYIERVP